MDASEAVDRLPQRLGAIIASHPEYQRLRAQGEPDPDPPPRCWTCYDRGFLRRDLPPEHPDFGKLVACDCRRAEIMRSRLAKFWAASAAPPQYRDCTLDSYPGDPTAVPALRDWLDTTAWLILTGPVGAGKTGLTVALLRVFAECGQSVLFVNAPSMLRRIRATYGDKSEGGDSEAAVINSLADVDVLAIDDIGKERLTEWATELLYDVVNRRYSEGRRTVVTTNLPTDRLEAHLGSATFWRLFERSQLIHVEGNLRRKRQATLGAT